MLNIVTTNPFGLGKVTVTTPGTPVLLLSNFPTLTGNKDNGLDLYANKFTILALSLNTGRVYIGAQTMVRATLVGVIMYMDPGQPWTFQHDVGMNKYHMGDFWVDADVAGEGVFANCDVV